MARAKGKARTMALVKDAAKELPAENVKISRKQAQIITDLEAQITALTNQRQTVLNTIAAAAKYDGMCNFVGLRQVGENFYVVLKPIASAPDPVPEG